MQDTKACSETLSSLPVERKSADSMAADPENAQQEPAYKKRGKIIFI
jgi:hypothetical protein